jgi:hypothetical protein
MSGRVLWVEATADIAEEAGSVIVCFRSLNFDLFERWFEDLLPHIGTD